MERNENEINPIEVPEKVKLQLDNFVLRLQKDFEQKERERAEQRLAIAEENKFFQISLSLATLAVQGMIVTLSFISAKLSKIMNLTDNENINYCLIITLVLTVVVILDVIIYKILRRH